MTELEKMDELKKRFDISYEEAKEALEKVDWDMDAAVFNLEQKKGSVTVESNSSSNDRQQSKENAEDIVKSIIEQIKSIIQEGNVTKVRLKNKEQTIIEIPATIGVVGMGVLLFSPLMLAFTAVGAVAAVAKEMVFEIEKSDGTIERRYLKWPEIVREKQDDSTQEN